jgi:hypothetical protein
LEGAPFEPLQKVGGKQEADEKTEKGPKKERKKKEENCRPIFSGKRPFIWVL